MAEEQKVKTLLGAGLLPRDNLLQDFVFTRLADVSKRCKKSDVEAPGEPFHLPPGPHSGNSFCTNTVKKVDLIFRELSGGDSPFLEKPIVLELQRTNACFFSLTTAVIYTDWATGASWTTCNGINSINDVRRWCMNGFGLTTSANDSNEGCDSVYDKCAWM